jgi:GNAT superfamily N-acetyltransferase
MVNYKRAESDNELQQILNIQKKALKTNVSQEEQKEQGYVTVPHTFEILKKMNDACPHLLAVVDGNVVGYALTMLESARYEMPILTPMFDIADGLYPNKNYLVMGQICIDKPYRGKGIFKGLYSYYRDELSSQFKCLITEVATLNTRSLNAHNAVGFKILENHVSEDICWEIISWEW